MCGRGPAESPIRYYYRRHNQSSFLSTWGANSYGQLGCGNVCEKQAPADTIVPFDQGSDQLRSVGGGGGFSYAVTESGQVFTCGNNSKGQLGHGDLTNLMVFTHCQSLSDMKIVKVAAGWDFLLAISDAGVLLSWGSNTFGQLGRDVWGGRSYDAVPAQVSDSSLGPHKDVAAGLRHGLSLSECGHVYSWGYGKQGQLGLGSSDKAVLAKAEHPLQVPVSCSEKPVQVIAGMNHSGLLTEAGSVLMWGCNRFGQCSQDPQLSRTVLVPSRVTEIENSNSVVVSVASGWTHVVARTAVGMLSSWGRADLGQLGRPCQKSCEHIPGTVAGLFGVTSHACGSEHTLAVTENGQVYSWGWNEHGICGTEHEENILEPLRVPLLLNKYVTSVGCGAGHSFCIVTDVHYQEAS